jgi:hypothetical protein
MYDDLCTHIASWGFVVASTGTETGLFPDTTEFALDTRSFLHWVETIAGDPNNWFFGMIDNGDWAAAGHSMGGGTLALLIGFEPRVRTIIGLQSAALGGAAVQNMQAFTGKAFQVAGSVDWIVPPSMVYTWFENALSASRNIFFLVEGMGHTGCTDTPPNGEPLPGPEQARLHRRLVTGLLRAEMRAEEDLYVDLVGEGMAVEPVTRQTDCEDPPFWARQSAFQPDQLVAGLGGSEENNALMAGSFIPASISTPYGELGLDPSALVVFYSAVLPASGWHESSLAIQPAWTGRTVYLQGLVLRNAGNGQLTRVVDLEL